MNFISFPALKRVFTVLIKESEHHLPLPNIGPCARGKGPNIIDIILNKGPSTSSPHQPVQYDSIDACYTNPISSSVTYRFCSSLLRGPAERIWQEAIAALILESFEILHIPPVTVSSYASPCLSIDELNPTQSTSVDSTNAQTLTGYQIQTIEFQTNFNTPHPTKPGPGIPFSVYNKFCRISLCQPLDFRSRQPHDTHNFDLGPTWCPALERRA